MQVTTKARLRPWTVLVGLVALVIGVGVGVLVARDDGRPAATLDPAAQVASVQQGCAQWLADDPNRPDTASWCSEMTGWMSDHLAAGTGMGPQMMWGDPDRLRATCQQWMAADQTTDGAASPDGRGWCDGMVDWMLDHMNGWSGHDSWGGWMGHGPMMGR
jgi:hypothetical protein